MSFSQLHNLPQLLLPWYEANRRELPWRQTKDPYAIWVSEIMLQQTRVEAVKGYYARFLDALPTISALSQCDDDLLHKLWEGLGYYSRVRNLKKAAIVIMDQYAGEFPKEYSQVLSLPGIGEYTAGAICSIAYDMPVPAVDGNVLRVLSRLTNDPSPIDDPKTKAKVRQMLLEIYPAQAGMFTQALMELGATLCGPNRRPSCTGCPCSGICMAKNAGTAEALPVKTPKKAKRQEDITLFLFRWEDKYALEKRPEKGLLAGLWQFPNVPGKLEVGEAMAAAEKMGVTPKALFRQSEKKHVFTHIQWNMRGFFLEVSNPGNLSWFSPEEIDTMTALPTAFRQFWEEVSYV